MQEIVQDLKIGLKESIAAAVVSAIQKAVKESAGSVLASVGLAPKEKKPEVKSSAPSDVAAPAANKTDAANKTIDSNKTTSVNVTKVEAVKADEQEKERQLRHRLKPGEERKIVAQADQFDMWASVTPLSHSKIEREFRPEPNYDPISRPSKPYEP